MLQAQGVAYPAIIVKDMQASLEFYTRLGLRVICLEPNRDDEESVVATLAVGDGDSFLQLVGPTHPGVNIAAGALGVGSMQYLALRVPAQQMREMFDAMSRAGVAGSEVIERGYERLVFLEDPNGVLVTLVAWATEPPEGMPRSRVLAHAATIRESEGAPFIEDAHVRQAIAELGG
ncbi:MAG: VOC family protein [Dehalococcoidia bacterium]